MGSVPQIYNLIQATNAEGLNLFVDADGNKVTTPPANLVDGYFPLYIDEGELTFDKSGSIVSPKQGVHYEKQEAGFSIDLDIDFTKVYSACTTILCINCKSGWFYIRTIRWS